MTQVLAPPNNSTAMAGLALGIMSAAIALIAGGLFGGRPIGLAAAFLLASLPALLAVIFGFVGISTANRLGGKRRGQAIWAVILGFTPWAFALIGMILKLSIFG